MIQILEAGDHESNTMLMPKDWWVVFFVVFFWYACLHCFPILERTFQSACMHISVHGCECVSVYKVANRVQFCWLVA